MSTDDTMLGTGRGADFYLYNWCRINPLFPRMLLTLADVVLYQKGSGLLMINLLLLRQGVFILQHSAWCRE